MNLPCQRSILFLLACLLLSPAAVRAQDGEGEALAQRFLEHLKANVPVAGSFEMNINFDPILYEEREKRLGKDVEMNGKHFKMVTEPKKQKYQCTWAWDNSREVMESPKEHQTGRTFLRTPEGYLEMADDKNFNLTARSSGGTFRPASFYFLRGTSSWSDVFSQKGTTFRTEAAPSGSPPGSTVLIVANPPASFEVRLILDKQTCRLHSHRSTYEGHPALDVFIDRTVQDREGKLIFPTSARLIAYESTHFKPFRFQTLEAKEVVFPKTTEQQEKWFQLILPTKTDIFDRVLNRHLTLSQPTSAETIISGDPNSIPTAEVRDIQPLRQTGSVPSTRYYFILSALAGSGVVIFVALLFWRVRARRLRNVA